MPGIKPEALALIDALIKKRAALSDAFFHQDIHISIRINEHHYSNLAIESLLSKSSARSIIAAIKEHIAAEIEDIDNQLEKLGVDTSGLEKPVWQHQ